MKTTILEKSPAAALFIVMLRKEKQRIFKAIGFFEAMKPNRDRRKCNIFRNEKQIIFEANGILEARDLMEIGGYTAFSWK